jgi:hypothetical protein
MTTKGAMSKMNESSIWIPKARLYINKSITKEVQIDADKLNQFSSENECSDDQEDQEEPIVNRTLVMLQKEMHKSLFSPSLMKINESPKVSLLTDRSKKSSRIERTCDEKEKSRISTSNNPTMIINQNANNPFHKDSIPNIFGMNIRPSSGEIVSPTSEESSRQSIRKDHLSKENRYQMQDDNSSEANSEEVLSLESIVIKKRMPSIKSNQNDSVEEAFTPNFITKRSSNSNAMGNEVEKLESSIFYKNREVNHYDYRPPLVSVLDSEGNRFEEEDEFSESIDGSEHVFNSNREDSERRTSLK